MIAERADWWLLWDCLEEEGLLAEDKMEAARWLALYTPGSRCGRAVRATTTGFMVRHNRNGQSLCGLSETKGALTLTMVSLRRELGGVETRAQEIQIDARSWARELPVLDPSWRGSVLVSAPPVTVCLHTFVTLFPSSFSMSS